MQKFSKSKMPHIRISYFLSAKAGKYAGRLHDVRGAQNNDYQDCREKLDNLPAGKYPVIIDEKVLKTVKKTNSLANAKIIF